MLTQQSINNGNAQKSAIVEFYISIMFHTCAKVKVLSF